MTLSIEDLPAPFGPMMARISCSWTSKETPWSATTPPKASEMSSISRIGVPVFLLAAMSGERNSGGFLGRGSAEGLRLHDLQVGRHRSGAAVLEAHLRLDETARLVRVESVDQNRVLVCDVAASHLARARELAVVGLELLVQDEEAPDLRVGERGVLREVAVDLLHAFADEIEYRGLRGEVCVAGIRQVAPLGPVADRGHVDVDECADLVAPLAEAHRFLDVGEELELVLEILWREQGAVGEPAHVFRAVDDLQVTPGIEITRVTGVEEALRVDRLARCVGPLVILLHETRGTHQHFARLGDAYLDPGHGRAHGFELDVARGVHAHGHAGFGHSVELFQVDADGAVEIEQVRTDRLAAGVGDANARHAQHVLERPVYENLAEPIQQPVTQRYPGLAFEDSHPYALGDGHEAVEIG